MIVTTANSVIDSQATESHEAEKNILPKRATKSRGTATIRVAATTIRARQQGKQRQNNQPRRDKRDVHGWVVLDKPIGMTSTHAVAVSSGCSRPSAPAMPARSIRSSGGLPIALGEATKTVPFVMDGRKRYRFTVTWGEERDTDDTEGRVVRTSDLRPSAEAIRDLLPQFTGLIEQIPPQYSAIKVQGERAYDLARDGETVEVEAAAGRNSRINPCRTWG
jgi:Pseudouridine synthase